MAAPVVAARNSGSDNNANNPVTVTLPASISAGDLLLAFIAGGSGGGTVTVPSGWTSLYNYAGPSSAAPKHVAIYRWADGAEGASVSVTQTTGRTAWSTLRITGAVNPATQPPEVTANATGAGASPNSTSLSPTGGSKDYLWITAAALDDIIATPTIPTNYANRNGAAVASSSPSLHTAERTLTAASEDPGAWATGSSWNWSAVTIAVHPGTAGPSITSVTPNTGVQSASNLSLAVVGTGFVTGCNASFSGTGISVDSTGFNSSTSLTVQIDITAGATLSARNLTVTNPDTSSAVLTNGFTVISASFPTVAGRNSGADNAGSSPVSITLPASISSGDLLILTATWASTGAVTLPSGWTSVYNDLGVAGNSPRNVCFARTANGSEGASIAVTGPGARSSWSTLRITGAKTTTQQLPDISANNASSGANADSLTLTPAGGAKNFLWLTVCHGDNVDPTPTAPTSYLNLNGAAASTTSPSTWTAERQRNIATEDPGAWVSAAFWAARTIAIHPTTASPTITSVSPSSGTQGASGLSLAVIGTLFASGAAVTFSGTGITVNSTQFNSSTSLTVNVTIAAGATLSARTVTITNTDASTGALAGGFTVTAPVAPTGGQIHSGQAKVLSSNTRRVEFSGMSVADAARLASGQAFKFQGEFLLFFTVASVISAVAPVTIELVNPYNGAKTLNSFFDYQVWGDFTPNLGLFEFAPQDIDIRDGMTQNMRILDARIGP